jgi:hypothetical protein
MIRRLPREHSGAAVTVDVIPATDVVFNSPGSITVATPAFPAATLHAVTVTDGALSGMIQAG